MIRDIFSRVGCLMLLVGAILLVLGVATLRSGQPSFNFLLLGALLSILGTVLWNQLRSKKRRNTRFSLFRKADDQEEDNNKEDNGWDDW